jgi:hypothetical protein
MVKMYFFPRVLAQVNTMEGRVPSIDTIICIDTRDRPYAPTQLWLAPFEQ